MFEDVLSVESVLGVFPDETIDEIDGCWRHIGRILHFLYLSNKFITFIILFMVYFRLMW